MVNELKHYGTKGMKWRRRKNVSGNDSGISAINFPAVSDRPVSNLSSSLPSISALNKSATMAKRPLGRHGASRHMPSKNFKGRKKVVSGNDLNAGRRGNSINGSKVGNINYLSRPLGSFSKNKKRKGQNYVNKYTNKRKFIK